MPRQSAIAIRLLLPRVRPKGQKGAESSVPMQLDRHGGSAAVKYIHSCMQMPCSLSYWIVRTAVAGTSSSHARMRLRRPHPDWYVEKAVRVNSSHTPVHCD